MKRSVELLGGGVLGLVLGTVFLADPIASAMTSYARAAWSLAGCPAGTYTLASTAQPVAGGTAYNATTSVRVPQADVVQVFNNLQPGQYSVSATLRRSDGAVAGSGAQMVTTEDGAIASTFMRSRDPAAAVRGTAGTRTAPPPPSTPAATAPATTPNPFRTVDRIATPRAVTAIEAGTRTAGPREWLVAELIRMSDTDGLEAGWHQVELKDLDGDGEVDEIRIEPPTGAAVVWRLVPLRLPVRTP